MTNTALRRACGALITLVAACGPRAPDASRLAHDANDPVVDDGAGLWQADSTAEYLANAQTLDWGVFDPALDGANYLPGAHPMTLRMQYWADQVDSMLRLRYPGALDAVPSPRIAIYRTDDVNAYVTSTALCLDNVSVHLNEATQTTPPNTGAMYASGALVDARNALGELSCKHVRATAAQVLRHVNLVNHGDARCKLALTVTGPDTYEIRPNGCRIDPLLAKLGGASAFVARPTSQHVTLYAGILRVMSEDQMVSILAHELGHYYHGHATLTDRRYGYLFRIGAANGATAPLAAPEFEPTAQAIRAALASKDQASMDRDGAIEDAPKAVYAPIAGQRFHSALYLPLKALVRAAETTACDGGVARDCACTTATTLLFGNLFRFGDLGLTGALLPEDGADYAKFEAAAVACLEPFQIAPLAGPKTVSRRAVFKAFYKGGLRPLYPLFRDLPPPAGGTLLAYLDKLSAAAGAKLPAISQSGLELLGTTQRRLAALSAQSDAADKVLDDARAKLQQNALGYYTTEEEADDLSAEWLSYLGFDARVGGDADMVFVQSFDGADELKRCGERRKAGWVNPDGSAMLEAWGPVGDPHPGDCFRARNFDKEADAHHYAKVAASPTAGLTPAWTDLVALIGGPLNLSTAVPAPAPAHSGRTLLSCRFAPKAD